MDVSPKTGKISSSGGVVTAEIKTYNDSSFYRFGGVELDRETLVLREGGTLSRYGDQKIQDSGEFHGYLQLRSTN